MKIALRRIADLTLYFSFCFLLGSGLMMKYSFVKGMRGLEIFGLGKPQWCDLHFCASILMLAALILHLALNAAWIHKVGAFSKKWLAIFIIVLGIALALLLSLYPPDKSKVAETQSQYMHRNINK
ncbi:MAG: DUF4405 domain-containing protein [Opitutales bacterium]|nr:DUF4405 domain-containing protein [Opitutales bacterium]